MLRSMTSRTLRFPPTLVYWFCFFSMEFIELLFEDRSKWLRVSIPEVWVRNSIDNSRTNRSKSGKPKSRGGGGVTHHFSFQSRNVLFRNPFPRGRGGQLVFSLVCRVMSRWYCSTLQEPCFGRVVLVYRPKEIEVAPSQGKLTVCFSIFYLRECSLKRLY